MVAPQSKVPNMVSGRTLVESTIWSHPGQKYQIRIFICRAAKMGKKIPERNFKHHWRKVKKRNTLFSSKFLNLNHLVEPRSKVPKILIRYFRLGYNQMHPIRQNFRIWPIWSQPSQKYPIRIFWFRRRLAKMGWRICEICKPPSIPETAFADLMQIVFLVLK